ncbi:hypothetical protein F7725_016631 [Dissostichus mawsoni]|uniref:Kinase n=1 Tax=Dissostichus mawsoni TaxID=36200 RepID=A0A7J5Z6E6_DISMA|nr:hypothetical protein F7725_016631 [Dissostichus mawsoni]
MPTIVWTGPEEDGSSCGRSGSKSHGGRAKATKAAPAELHGERGGGALLCAAPREQTICKPLITREHQFYESVPAELRKFIPQYRGVVSVSFEEDEEGNLCFIAYPLQSDPAPDLENKDPSADIHLGMLIWEKMIASSSLVDSENYSKDGRCRLSCSDKDKSDQRLKEKIEVLCYRLDSSHSNAVPQHTHNPWTHTRKHHQLQKLQQSAMHRNKYKPDVAAHFTCVLDLKMGIQQHGDDVTEEKKARKIYKCQQSTVSQLGVVLSGMQEALLQFFHSGQRLRRELLSPVIQRLRELQAALETCESYRFYSSSLLIIYDGAPQPKHAEDGLSEEEDEDEEVEPDMEEEKREGEAAGAFGIPRRPSTSSDGSIRDGSLARSPMVEVRMIDFAHTTCSHYQGDSVVYEGLDSGYIFGLQNLITIISELENTSTD